MKKKLHLYFTVTFMLLFFANDGYAQISYTEGFEQEGYAWTDEDFFADDALACTGDIVFVGESFTFDDFNIRSSTMAPVGISNGQEAIFTYNYKILDYDTGTAISNEVEWGSILVSYATNSSGPWTELETITPDNHTSSGNCAARSITFTPPGGALYIRFIVAANPALDGIDILFYLDDISVTQAASVACTGTPDASTAVAASAGICNSAMASLSLAPAYVSTGLTFQWQTSADNITFTDVAANGTADTFEATQSENTYYRAVITCTASGESVTSTAVQVINTGVECTCNLVFNLNIEPITHVVFAGIDNVSPEEVNGSPGQENFTNIAPAQVMLGQTYPVTIEGNTDGNFENYFTVLIDFNQNGDFSDSGEAFEIGTIENSTGIDDQQLTGNIVIPATAATGLTNMRVLKLFSTYSDNGCANENGSNFGYGQGEDYLINISEFVAGVEGFTASNFRFYPNPVTDVLTINYANKIDTIEVFNLLGQKVMEKNVNNNVTQVGMQSLTAGTYMVRVNADGVAKTVKVIKQ